MIRSIQRKLRVLPLVPLATLTLLVFAACWQPQHSLAPLYSSKKTARDDRILGYWNPGSDRAGEWTVEKDQFTIRKSGSGYVVSVGEPNRTNLHLVRLGRYLFVDVTVTAPKWARPPDHPKRRPPALAHEIGRITVTPNVLIFRMMSAGVKVDALAGAKKLQLKREPGGGAHGKSVLTSSTSALQNVLLEHANDKELLSQPFVLCRNGADCAMEVPREEFRLDPHDANAGQRLALVYMRRGRFNDALRTWKQIAQIKPGPTDNVLRFTQYQLELACAFVDWGYTDTGMAVLKSGVDAFPKDVEAWMRLALGNLYANRPQSAMTAFRTAAEIVGSDRRLFDPRLPYVAWAIALRMREYDEALKQAALSDEDRLIALTDFTAGNYESAYEKISGGSEDFLPATAEILRYRLNGKVALNRTDEQPFKIQWVGSYFEQRLPIPVKDQERFLRGDVSEEQFLAQFHARQGQFVQPELCVGYYLAGEKYLIDGDREKARRYFGKAVDTHAYGYLEWMVANARLRSIESETAQSQ